MKRIIIFMICTVFTVLLGGCQDLNNKLDEVNNSLATLNNPSLASKPTASKKTTATTDKPKIKNQWGVADKNALSWLAQNKPTWNNNNKLGNVNWFKFWSEQIHTKTGLAQTAHNYCNSNSWDNKKPGDNCQIFWQAYSATKAQENIDYGKKIQQEI
jgi:hypothetical protein